MAEIRATKDNLFEEISHLIEEARQHVKKAVNTAMVYTYYNIGKHIVENEQHNNQRAAYGKKVLQQLSNKLTDRFGKGWPVETLTLTRKFYLTYAGPKSQTLFTIFRNTLMTYPLSPFHGRLSA